MMVQQNRNALVSTLFLKSLLLLGLPCYQFFFINCRIAIHYFLPFLYIYIYIYIYIYVCVEHHRHFFVSIFFCWSFCMYITTLYLQSTYKSYIPFVIHPPLMMAQSQAESTWEINNYGRYINQFPPNIINSIRQSKRINKKICRQKMSIMLNKICINEEMLPIYIYIYIYIYHYVMLLAWISLTLSLGIHLYFPSKVCTELCC